MSLSLGLTTQLDPSSEGTPGQGGVQLLGGGGLTGYQCWTGHRQHNSYTYIHSDRQTHNLKGRHRGERESERASERDRESESARSLT